MRNRMTSEKRREQLLKIMKELFGKAKTQRDFTAARLAGEAGVSIVRFYRLVGNEFKELRSQLEGPRQPVETVIGRLKGQIKELRKHIRDLKAKLNGAAPAGVAESVRIIERLDEDNRMLRSEVKMLRSWLEEGGTVIILPPPSGYSIKRKGYVSLV